MNFSRLISLTLQKMWVKDATCVQTVYMLDLLGFLNCMFERYSCYFIFNELLLNFSQRLGTRRAFARLIDLRLQKVWEDWDAMG